ncbi:MAG: sigma-70 family RNA polymerase sigma factor [Candidatus Brocadiia bacterium]
MASMENVGRQSPEQSSDPADYGGVITPEELRDLRSLPPSDLTDAQLVHLVQNGEEQVFDWLVTRYQDRIYNTSVRMLGDADEALEATQEVFVKAYRGVARFEFKSSFYTWLFQIALNYCRSRLRTYGRSGRMKMLPLDAAGDDDEPQAFSIPDDAPLPLDRLERKELAAAAEKALARLRPEFREVIILRDIDGLNYDQIAIMLDCSMGTVKSRLHRARNALAVALRKYIEG